VQKILTVGVIAAAFVATLTFGGDGTLQNEPSAAQAGDIAPAVTIVNAPVYWRGPRIIHVPQAGDRHEDDYDHAVKRAARRAPVASIGDDDDDEPAPPPRRRVAPVARQQEEASRPRGPRWQLRSDAPPQRSTELAPPPAPLGPRRAILSAPPLPPEGPTPLRPTPRFGVKADASEKFAAPRDAKAGLAQPYRPPSDLPPSEND
jgi:hypothetical protein